MNFRLVSYRTLPCPTLLGWVVLILLAGTIPLFWVLQAENFLSLNRPVQAEILVVEGWIDVEGADAAAIILKQPHSPYKYVVAAGSLTGEIWNKRRWSNAEIAAIELHREGVPTDQIIVADTGAVESQRTFATAVAARRALEQKGIAVSAINVFTRGPHARRSRLIFSKVFGSRVMVGVISWTPPGYDSGPWWKSSERSNDIIRETVGYFFELLLNSGRGSTPVSKNVALSG
jgi:uncharacterized SAM-binding protein YcdF (DUF218 family)